MTRLAETTAHIQSMGELLNIVGAMRSLAGMRMQEAQRTLPGIHRFAETVALAIADTQPQLAQVPSPSASATRAVVLCTSEHGFVGGFNEQLLAAIDGSHRGALVFVLGARGAALARERNIPVTWAHPMATRVAAAPELVTRLSSELYARIAAAEVTEVEVIFVPHRQGHAGTIERRVLFPIDPASFSGSRRLQPPLTNLAPDLLRERLLAEYVAALLTEAIVESIAGENAARFAAMDSAHENVSKKLEELRQEERQMRQSEITSEMLELITGASVAR